MSEQGENKMANNEYSMQDIYDALSDIDKTLNTTADGTNWTVADSLSNIAINLERIADVADRCSKAMNIRTADALEKK